MDFNLTNDQLEIKDLAMKFAKNEMMPKASEFDEKATMPLDILRKAWELGLVNTCIPAEYGGNGFTAIDSMIITEALAYGCMGMNTSIMANDLALLPIVIGGNDEQKKRFLTPFTQDYKIAAFCLTEPGNGSDAGGIKTLIKEDGDDVVINGNKMWITNAGYADLFVLYGTTDPALKHKGITAVVIEKGTPGIEVGKKEDKMGHRCSDTRAVTFNNVRVPKKNILGGLNQGWKIAMKTLDHSRPMVASSAVGGAQCAFDHAVKYAKERVQFNVPIANHQAIQFMIADMAMKIEASRLLVHKAAWLLDNNLPNTQLASYSKAFAADSCMQIATDAVQIYGGYGYSKEYPVEKIMRDAKLIQLYEGTSQIQRLVIAKEIFTR
ncbi:acyl-CoA dehydrogenase [Bacteriovorax stolpii]|uniref:Acyl-CoA dehydrogenase n=1 Tax=Bacteriovorax stolpii TaxID=960 RepID=A0A2K9NX24_BACTC|nr:acyl-CoA dehydrogenase family protein [Bacteriovorax stolpii]AUO00074.1 acyl-CoA dehydrogenase [Bacteriovorax stolpii]QDK39934.1 acyl-CoA dehydrogenase [Bacteriovorax stolpii]TDP54033.1 acyl-CoA dehydrogenase [Bacteriovorax stolpii]